MHFKAFCKNQVCSSTYPSFKNSEWVNSLYCLTFSIDHRPVVWAALINRVTQWPPEPLSLTAGGVGLCVLSAWPLMSRVWLGVCVCVCVIRLWDCYCYRDGSMSHVCGWFLTLLPTLTRLWTQTAKGRAFGLKLVYSISILMLSGGQNWICAVFTH